MSGKVFVQTDFTGGENDLLPPHLIAKNELVKLTNMFPGYDSEPLCVRPGTRVLGIVGDGTKQVTLATKFGAYYVAATDTAVYWSDNRSTWTVLHTWTTAGFATRCAVILNKLFLTNGKDPIVCWNGITGVGKTIETVLDRTLVAPTAPWITTFRGRLWIAGTGSTVAYCGTSDIEAIPNTTPTQYYPRWKNWSGAGSSDGGSLIVGADDGQEVTGIGTLFNGVVIFKERTTYIWMYGDTDIPKFDGRIEVLVPGVGCSSHDSIDYYNGAIMFLGQGSDGDYAVYRLIGQGADEVSIKIPSALKRVVARSTNKPRAKVFDHYYFLSADDVDAAGNLRTLTYALDLRRNSWTEITGWTVGCYGVDPEGQRLFIGSNATDGVLHDYPYGWMDGTLPIEFGMESRVIDGGDPISDHRWRDLWLDLQGSANNFTVTTVFDGVTASDSYPNIRKDDVDYWDDPLDPDNFWDRDATVWFDADLQLRVNVPISKRSKVMQVRMTGETTGDKLALQRIGVAFRDRKTQDK